MSTSSGEGHSKSSGTVTIVKFTYTFDSIGQKLTESQPSGVGIAYTYDAVGQLTDEVRTGGSSFSANYTYDNAGNRLTKTVGGVTESYTYDDANKLTSAGGKSYGYDNAGNVTGVTSGGVTTTVTWDGAGRLISVSGGGLGTTNTSTYNGIGQRVEKVDSTGAYYLTLADDAIDSRVLDDSVATYQHGLGLVSETRSSAVKFFHTDPLGTARALTNTSGGKTDGLETDAFGMVVATVGAPLGASPFGFAADHGYQTDSDTNLQRLGHRFYDPSTGRFLSRDPIQDGYNWYAYCDNDPVNGFDPQGLRVLRAIGNALIKLGKFLEKLGEKLVKRGSPKSTKTPWRYQIPKNGSPISPPPYAKGETHVISDGRSTVQELWDKAYPRDQYPPNGGAIGIGIGIGFGAIKDWFDPIGDIKGAVELGVEHGYDPFKARADRTVRKYYGDLLE